MRKLIIVVMALIMMVGVTGCSENRELYDEGMDLYQKGNYEEAYDCFIELEDYRDSEEQAEKCIDAIQEEMKANFDSLTWKASKDALHPIGQFIRISKINNNELLVEHIYFLSICYGVYDSGVVECDDFNPCSFEIYADMTHSDNSDTNRIKISNGSRFDKINYDGDTYTLTDEVDCDMWDFYEACELACETFRNMVGPSIMLSDGRMETFQIENGRIADFEVLSDGNTIKVDFLSKGEYFLYEYNELTNENEFTSENTTCDFMFTLEKNKDGKYTIINREHNVDL